MRRYRHRALLLMLVFPISLSCTKRTDNPTAEVVKLRDSIVNLVEGSKTEVKGRTAPSEFYVLLAGYMQERDFDLPSIPPKLRSQLAQIAPPHEQYALARIQGDRVTEYTYFARHWPRDRERESSPGVLEPCPMVIDTDPFVLTRRVESSGLTVLTLENK